MDLNLPLAIEHLLSLPENLRPSWDAYFMAVSLLLSSRSSCGRLHVGCLIVSAGKEGKRIVAAGYNGFLAGAPHVSRVRNNHEEATIHAEQNAVADAAKRGVSLVGSTAYISHFPCINCAKILAAAGIQKIFYWHDYNNDPLVPELLTEWGVEFRCLRDMADGESMLPAESLIQP